MDDASSPLVRVPGGACRQCGHAPIYRDTDGVTWCGNCQPVDGRPPNIQDAAQADGVVAAVLLQAHNALAPGDLA